MQGASKEQPGLVIPNEKASWELKVAIKQRMVPLCLSTAAASIDSPGEAKSQAQVMIATDQEQAQLQHSPRSGLSSRTELK